MLSAKLKKFCLLIIRWGSYLILLLPVVVYSQVLFPYVFSKVIIFRIIVECLLAIWLLLIIYNKSYRPNWRHPLILTSTIFLAALFVTSVFGVDFYRSFWSNQERMTGLFTLLHLWLWFIILTSVFKKWSDWAKLIGVSLACSVLVGLYGLGQRMGLLSINVSRMASTLGNPIFLGAYAMLNIFLGAVLFIRSRQKLIKVLTTLAMIFNVVIMLLTVSRSVILSFGVAILIFIIFVVLKKLSPKPPSLRQLADSAGQANAPSPKGHGGTKTWGIIILILLLLAILSAYVYLQTPAGKPIQGKLPYLSRFLDFKALTSGLSQRTAPWQIAWQGFKERPVLGWGWENYNIVFNKYYQPKFLEWGLAGTWFDRSHNQIMDLLATSGVIGALAYLSFYGAIFYLLIKKMKRTEAFREKLPFLILILMFVAYFMQNLTVFDTPGPLIIFYFSLGLVYFVTTENADARGLDADARGQQLNRLQTTGYKLQAKRFPLPLAIFLLLIFVLFIIYKSNLIPLKQSSLGLTARSAIYNNFLNDGLSLFKKSLAPGTFINPEIRMQLAASLVSMSPTQDMINGGDFYKAINMSIAEMKINTIEHPQDARYRLYLAQLYNFAQLYSFRPGDDLSYSQHAEQAIAAGLALSPRRQQFYFELSQTKINEGKYQEAIDSSKIALNFDEDASIAHYNLATTYLENKQNNLAPTKDLAIQELETAAKISLSNTELAFLLNIADTYASLNQYNQAIENRYDKALEVVNQIISHPIFYDQQQKFKDQVYTQKTLYLEKLNDLAGTKERSE